MTGCLAMQGSESLPGGPDVPVLKLGPDASAAPAHLQLHSYWEDASPRATPTDVYVSCEGDVLRVVYVVSDADIRATRTGRDSETFRDDCVELFLSLPENTPGKAVGIEVNTLGTITDYVYRHVNRIDTSPDLIRVTAAFTFFEEAPAGASFSGPGYQATLTVSLAEVAKLLGSESVPHQWRMNFARWDHPAGEERVLTIWSDPRLPRQHPHNPERYGWVLLEGAE